MTAWTSFMKEFYSNERKNYRSCAKSGTLKRAAKIYNCQKKKAKQIENRAKKSEKNNKKGTFTMLNPMFKNKFRKTMKKSKK